MISILFLFFASMASGFNISYDSVQSVQVCELTNLMPAPSGISYNLLMTRLAWPVNGPILDVPLIVNTIDPVGDPDVICLAGCASPPCYPISHCNPNDLWWSTRYTDLIVEPGSNLRLPNSANPLPPVFMMLYDEYAPSPSPSPSPSPMLSASPSPSPSPSQNVSASVASVASIISVTFCDMCYSNETIPALSAFVVLFALCLGYVSRAWYLAQINALCPYCAVKHPVRNLQEHLRMCPEHLTKFTAIVVDQVHIVPNDVNIHMVSVAEQEDDRAIPELTPRSR